MTFLTSFGGLYQVQPQARALAAWRDAALLVQLRWTTFREAEGVSRAGAFAAYVAALDAEAAAAGELANAHVELAAAA